MGGSQRVDGLEAPLTGRDAELRTIKDLFHAAAERKVPRLVLVSGPAGVGKSRLGWEFEKYADGLAGSVWWHRGRCLAYGEGVAFWALAEIVRQRLGIAEEDPAEVAAGKLAAGLDQFVPDPAERAYVGPRLGRLLGVAAAGDSGAALSREELFAGWRLFFERLAADASGRPARRGRPVRRQRPAGIPGPSHRLGQEPAGLRAGLRPPGARPRPARVRHRAQPEHADPGPARPGIDGPAGRRAGPRDAPAARSAVTSQAQGIPLFAVETVRALIDRDIVRPVEGVYQLTGDVGELAVPDSLHALLAARLDALDPAVRRLVTDAAVLGASFPAEALIAVSGRDEPAVRAALADLVRREVLTVSADPLSPERGSYRFAQQMLRQVAYDTLSRRDRKTRHLAVAAHLRAAFAGDGEELTDVIAQHYLDALHAVPDDPDTAQIRDQAIGTLVRAAERAARTGAAGQAATSYATAAELSQLAGQANQADTGLLWEKAAQAAIVAADYAERHSHAGRAHDYHLDRGQARAAARTQATVGRALRLWGRLAEAHEQLTAALLVLRADPDADTVRTLDELATLSVHAGSPDADRLSSEALILGQALGVGRDQLSNSFVTRGVFLITVERRPESVAYLREAARLATQTGDNVQLGRALVNLSDALAVTDPQAAAEAARSAAEHARRVGARTSLTFAIFNLVQALLMVGDWDAADRELIQADSDGLAVIEHIVCYRGWVAALRGDVDTAEAMLAGLRDLRGNEDAQTKAEISLAEAFIAAVRRQPDEALRHARDVVALRDALGISHECVRWAWPLAARAAHELGDVATTGDLLALLDSYQPGYLAPVLQAERDLSRARLADRDDGQSADAAFAVGDRQPAPAEHPLSPRSRATRPRGAPSRPG